MPPPGSPRTDRATASHDGASDLATFGALPVALIGAPALADTGLMTPTASARIAFGPDARDATGGATGGDSGHAPATPFSETVGHALAPTPLAGPISMPVALAAGTGDVHAAPAAGSSPPSGPASSGIATFVPMPHGSGAVAEAAQIATDTPHGVADGVAPVVMVPTGDAMESMRASVAVLQDALDTLAGRLPPAPGADPVESTVSHLGDAAATTLGTVGATVDHLGETVGTLLTSAGGMLDHVLAGAPDAGTIASLATSTLSEVTGLTSGLAPVVGTIVAPIAATIDHIVTAAPDIASIVSPVSTTLGDVAHTVASATTPVLDHIGGGDPVGGIATLVGMVSAADAFNLHDSGSDAGADLAPALGIAGAVDLLADVVPHESLLGIGDHHGDGIAGIDLHDGLFGHG